MHNTFAAVRNRARLSFFFSDAICVSVVLQIIYVFLFFRKNHMSFYVPGRPNFRVTKLRAAILLVFL